MPLSPTQAERINEALSALGPPFCIFNIDPTVSDSDLDFVIKELLEYLDDSLHISANHLERNDNVYNAGVARLLWMHAWCFHLYRALVGDRLFQPQSGKSPLDEARAAARNWRA